MLWAGQLFLVLVASILPCKTVCSVFGRDGRYAAVYQSLAALTPQTITDELLGTCLADFRFPTNRIPVLQRCQNSHRQPRT